jgi:hypothetical protein
MRVFRVAGIAAILAGAAAASGGVVFTATSKSESPTLKSASLADTSVRGWADGPRGKVEIRAGRNPSKGTVLLTDDGGKTARLFDPAAKSCRSWPDRRPSEAAASRPGVSASVSNFHLDASPAGPGPKIAGVATRHYRFEIGFDSTTSAMGSSLRSHIEKTEDLWAAEEIEEPGLRLWLNVASPTTGDPAADRKIARALDAVPGAILKRVTTASLSSDSGPNLETTTVVRVTKLERKPIAPAVFAAPFACAEGSPNRRPAR